MEERLLFLLEYQDEVAIQKRSNEGLLAGLWEFPNLLKTKTKKKEEEVIRESLEKFSVYVSDLVETREGKHIFSHIEWQLKGIKIKIKEKPENENLVFVKKSEIEEYAIPTAFKLGKELLF